MIANRGRQGAHTAHEPGDLPEAPGLLLREDTEGAMTERHITPCLVANVDKGFFHGCTGDAATDDRAEGGPRRPRAAGALFRAPRRRRLLRQGHRVLPERTSVRRADRTDSQARRALIGLGL